jgi:hypothetical protein
LEVGGFNDVAIANAERSNSAADELFSNDGPECAASDEQHGRLGEALLPRRANLRQKDLTVIT